MTLSHYNHPPPQPHIIPNTTHSSWVHITPITNRSWKNLRIRTLAIPHSTKITQKATAETDASDAYEITLALCIVRRQCPVTYFYDDATFLLNTAPYGGFIRSNHGPGNLQDLQSHFHPRMHARVQYLLQDIWANRSTPVSGGALENWYFTDSSPSSIRMINHISSPGSISTTGYTRTHAIFDHSSFLSVSLMKKRLHSESSSWFLRSLTSIGCGSPSRIFSFVGIRPRSPFRSGISFSGLFNQNLVFTWISAI